MPTVSPSKRSADSGTPEGSVSPREADAPRVPWSRYRDNLARHLNGLSRDLQSRVMGTLAEEKGFGGLRPSFGPILSLVRGEGRPIGELASELAISRQACGQLVDLVAAAGYLERRPNPADRRSKLVVRTRRGGALVEEGVGLILEREADYAALVGEGAYRRFTTALAALYPALGLPTDGDRAWMARARRSIGVLPLVAERINQELMTALIARGHPHLKMSHAQVLPLLGPEGGRIHEIARLQGVSRQAISATSQELVALDYLCRRPDPKDRRGVVLELTKQGEGLIADSLSALDRLEARFRDLLGESGFEDLRGVAADLYHARQLETGLFRLETVETDAPGSATGATASRGDREIEAIANRLQQWLGCEDAARLAEQLEFRSRRSLT